jgi:putative ABC transport system permease protein
MSLWKIVLKNIAQRRLSSTLTAASIALGVAIVTAVLALRAQSRDEFSQSAFGYELVVGPKGSALQLVLNTVYHMDNAQGTIPWARYQDLAAHKGVAHAIPMAVGDSYRGSRIIGTTAAFFTGIEIQPGRRFEIEGRSFDGIFEAVAGARTGLKTGDTFQPSHGVLEGGEAHAEQWTVVGILKPTATPNDRAVFINLEGFQAIRDHRQTSEISAVIVKTRSAGALLQIRHDLNQLPDCMAVVPAQVMGEFFEKFDWVPLLFLALSLLVVVMAAVSIFLAITNSMAERRRPIAILRALGARRTTVLSIILFEATALCFFGGVAGILLGHALTAAAGALLSESSGVAFSPFSFHPREFAVLGGVLLLGALAGILPALQAYRTDIADGLHPSS